MLVLALLALVGFVCVITRALIERRRLNAVIDVFASETVRAVFVGRWSERKDMESKLSSRLKAFGWRSRILLLLEYNREPDSPPEMRELMTRLVRSLSRFNFSNHSSGKPICKGALRRFLCYRALELQPLKQLSYRNVRLWKEVVRAELGAELRDCEMEPASQPETLQVSYHMMSPGGDQHTDFSRRPQTLEQEVVAVETGLVQRAQLECTAHSNSCEACPTCGRPY